MGQAQKGQYVIFQYKMQNNFFWKYQGRNHHGFEAISFYNQFMHMMTPKNQVTIEVHIYLLPSSQLKQLPSNNTSTDITMSKATILPQGKQKATLYHL